MLNNKFNETNKPTIKSTIKLANMLHKGQKDPIGQKYIHHPIRVAANAKTLMPLMPDDAIMAAILHDTVEDCDIDEDGLRAHGYSEETIKIVMLLTKEDGDNTPYNEAIQKIIDSGNAYAMILKIADNMDNLHPQRIKAYKELDFEQASDAEQRYHNSIEKLTKELGDKLSVTNKEILNLIANARPVKDSKPRLKALLTS